MKDIHKIKVPKVPLAEGQLGVFQATRLAGKVLLTNDVGNWHFLSEEAYSDFLAGRIADGHPETAALTEKNFLREGLDIDALAGQLRDKKYFVGQGPHLHVMVVTLRCNQTCLYCHASRATEDRSETDMSMETAKQAVDLALQTSSPYVNFEFQGGEPTLHMPVVKFTVDYSREKNRAEQKRIEYSIVTNMTTMNDDIADWLVDNGVLVCASLDGPEPVHDFNRPWKSGQSAHATCLDWMGKINARYAERGLDPNLWHVDALMTTTRKTLDHWRQLVDQYVAIGSRSIHLRPLNPYGFALKTWESIGYTTEEYLEFYKKALDYIIELNLQGTELVEGTAAIFLQKILTGSDPNFVDIRSPCGAGVGQVAYNYDGKIFPCDEARMVAAIGSDLFQIGTLGEAQYRGVVTHPTVRTFSVASLLESLPMCSTCWNQPFCGVCPMHNYQLSGDLFGQRPCSPKCQEYMGISKLLFEKLADDEDGRIEKIFNRWILARPRGTYSDPQIEEVQA